MAREGIRAHRAVHRQVIAHRNRKVVREGDPQASRQAMEKAAMIPESAGPAKGDYAIQFHP